MGPFQYMCGSLRPMHVRVHNRCLPYSSLLQAELGPAGSLALSVSVSVPTSLKFTQLQKRRFVAAQGGSSQRKAVQA